MKIGKLIEQLGFLQQHYGDLDCVVYADAGIDPVKRARLHVLQDFDFGNLGSKRTGDRVVVVWARE